MTEPRSHGAGEASAHFLDERGADYFARYKLSAEQAADLNLGKFEHHVKPGDTVVDFGCGTGALLARLPAARKIGVEVNDLSRKKARSRGLEVLPSAADLPDELADLVISNHALEHTLHPLAELRELIRALKPGGKLVLWLPLDDWRAQRSPKGRDLDNHLFGWTPQTLANLLTEAGFEVESVAVVPHAWRLGFLRVKDRLPRGLYRALTFVTAAVLRRRQLCAIARKRAAA